MSFANAAMLIGLAGVAIPLLIHLLSRRRVPTIAWGAMQFLDLGRRARRRFRLAELLLLVTRMLLIALVALAAARPIWSAGIVASDPAGPRDIVLVVDASSGMARRGGGTSPIDRALNWASSFVDHLRPGDAVAILRAGPRARAVLDPPSVDPERVRDALRHLPQPGGSSDIPAALGEAFRILERPRNPATEVVVLTDLDRAAWNPTHQSRWELLRDLHDRLPVPPRISLVGFPVEADPEAADGSILDVLASRRLVAPGATIGVSAMVHNAGPAPLERSAELVIDGVPVPGSTRAVGPVPAGSSVPIGFQASLDEPGSHALAVRLSPGGTPDPLPINDEATSVIEVTEALPVLLVDGEPGPGPMAGEVDYLRAALMPQGDEAPQVHATVIGPEALTADMLGDQRVVVLANVDRLTPEQADAIAGFLDRGGGVLVVPGDRTNADAWNLETYRDGQGWLPARIGALQGRFADRKAVARLSTPSFTGPVLGPLGQGDAPPLGSAALFGAFELAPAEAAPPAEVPGNLDSGLPWLVERPAGEGRAAMLAGPLDAEGGTLPANPDFVPLVHELVFRLADPLADAPPTQPGEPLILPLTTPPDPEVTAIPVQTPSGGMAQATVDRSGERVSARLDETDEPGLYRFELPKRPVYRVVAGGDQRVEPTPLSPVEAERLAEGWPLSLTDDPTSILQNNGAGRSPRPLWRGLILAALAGLCLEIGLTRRLSRNRRPSSSD